MTSSSFSGVMLIDCLTQAALHNVCVDLGSTEVSMAQHELHAPQVGAALKQMRCEGVA